MNLFQNVLLDVILILFPLLVYILYDAYNKVYNIEKSDLFFDFAIITSFYLIITFKFDGYSFPYLMMNVPLILAYLKKRNNSILIISILCCIILSKLYEFIIIIFILEYFIYYMLYKLSIKNKIRFINIFLIIKILSYFLCEVIAKPYVKNDIEYNLNVLNIIIPFILVTYVVFIIIKKASGIIDFKQDRDKLEEEKEIRMSLFKITHEIKNPITVCKGYLDMFDIEKKEKSKKYINIMKDEINRVLILLEDFLSINKIKIEKDIIDINLLLEEVTNNFIPILKEKNINKIFNISKDELFINADYNRLNQVLINLIKNSIESIENENGFINVFLIKNKNFIEIHVEDNGLGMNEEELNNIKEPFFTTKKQGSGLGIYLSRQIIEAHGGQLEYFSSKNIGTQAIITLPYEEIFT